MIKKSHPSENNKISHITKWHPNTILVTSESIINQLDEKRLTNSAKTPIKVRSFSGARVQDVYNYLTPLLERA